MTGTRGGEGAIARAARLVAETADQCSWEGQDAVESWALDALSHALEGEDGEAARLIARYGDAPWMRSDDGGGSPFYRSEYAAAPPPPAGAGRRSEREEPFLAAAEELDEDRTSPLEYAAALDRLAAAPGVPCGAAAAASVAIAEAHAAGYPAGSMDRARGLLAAAPAPADAPGPRRREAAANAARYEAIRAALAPAGGD